MALPRASIRKGGYKDTSIRKRLEGFFLDNVGKVAGNDQLREVATDPTTGEEPENWHQRLSELRTDHGYTILTNRDRTDLRIGEYMLESATRRESAGKRVMPSPYVWRAVMERAKARCEWNEGGQRCGLAEGETDPVGGGTVKLTADHKRPHAMDPKSDPDDPNAWQALCGRHQVVKKNYWDNSTGKLNVVAIVQQASKRVKEEVYAFLKRYFGDT